MSPKYEITSYPSKAGLALYEYFKEKESGGLFENVEAEFPYSPSIWADIHAGTCRTVLKPWLEDFAAEWHLHFVVTVYSLGPTLIAIELWPPDYVLRVKVEWDKAVPGRGSVEFISSWKE
jgi:hypothetical protein